MKKKSSLTTLKNVILSLIMILAIGLDCWGLYIRLHGKEKIAPYTFKVGKQVASAIDPVTGEETTEDRWFCEVNIYDNCYEILFNYFTDENKTEFYSQGLQFIINENSSKNFKDSMNQNYTKTSSENINFYFNDSLKDYTGTTEEIIKYTEFLWSSSTIKKTFNNYYKILSDKKYPNLEVSNFASANNYEDTIFSPNPLNENSYFAIQMEDEVYYMKMRGSDYNYLSNNKDKFYLLETTDYKSKEETGFWNAVLNYKYDRTEYFRTCDIYYLAELIYNSCETLDYSSDGIIVNFEFGNLFNYYYDFEEVITENNINNKIINFIKSYYQIKVNKFKGNMTSANQSLFNYFKGSQNYNEELAGDAEDSEVFTDYHHGRSILELNEDYFNVKLESKINGDFIIKDGTNNVIQSGDELYKIYLELKDEFKNRYTSANGYRLRIRISLDEIWFTNSEFAGFVDGTFDGYTIYKVTTYSVLSGELYEEDITQEVINGA